MTDDERHEKLCAFQKEFAQLVRKYVPVFPLETKRQIDAWAAIGHPRARVVLDRQSNLLLVQMQDSTSVYSPYVWSEEFDETR